MTLNTYERCNPQVRGLDLLQKIRTDFIGIDTHYTLATNKRSKRHFLDSAASTLMMKTAQATAFEFLKHYSNTHSTTHFSARISTEAYEWAHARILSFLNADPADYTCIFLGSGSTSCFNRISKIFRDLKPDQNTVLISLMEHHSNDLPHRKHHDNVLHIPLEGEGKHMGHLNMIALEDLLQKYQGDVSYVAVTAASNVTGIINPIHEIAQLAHAYGAYVVVDGSQIVARQSVNVGQNVPHSRNIDAFIFSGHKVYAPGSPGVMVVRREVIQDVVPTDVGGGMVNRVFRQSYEVSPKLPDREEAGTPNILGAITLAAAIEVLDRIGMDVVSKEEERLLQMLLLGLQDIPELTIYGSDDLSRYPRVATVAFNLRGFDHGLLAAILNDYYNVAVRNDCFCAHPYVREMLLQELWDLDVLNALNQDVFDQLDQEFIKARQGMVRVSLGLYTTERDIAAFLSAIHDLNFRHDFYVQQYSYQGNGVYRHNEFQPNLTSLFHPQDVVNFFLKNK